MDLQREFLSKNHPQEVYRFYWGGHNIFWEKSCFVSSVGNVSQETIQRYIENQG